MGNEIGKLVGKVIDNFSITNDDGVKVQLRVTYDYSTASNIDIQNWLNGNRRIAFQRPTRGMSYEELKALNGTVIMAVDAGKKVKTKAERVKDAQATINALRANFPEEYAAMVNEMSVDKGE